MKPQRRTAVCCKDSHILNEASKRKHGDKISVLIVDDDEQLRKVLTDVLSIDGYHVHACADGFSALEMLKKERFDLLITDLGMPGMSGLDLAEVVDATHPQMPIALITGLRTEVNQDEASEKGVRAVLFKPFHLHEVKALIHNLVTAATETEVSERKSP